MEMTRLTKLGSCLWICAAYRWRKLAVALVIAIVAAIVAHKVYAGETYDIVIKAGEDYRRTHTWADKAGTPINLTGSSYVSQFRAAPDGAVFATFSTVTIDASAGKLRHSLSRRQTATLGKKVGVWDIRQTDAAGLVSYRYGGTVKVLPTVSAP